MGLAFFVVNILGLGFDDIPSVIPEFK
jgi:predicted secreted protein